MWQILSRRRADAIGRLADFFDRLPGRDFLLAGAIIVGVVVAAAFLLGWIAKGILA